MSVLISNLPEYTGNTYNGYIIWNDSGETTTYKTRYINSPFLSTGTTNKVIQPVDDKALLQIGSGNTFNDYSGSNLKNAVVIGNRNKVDGIANKPVMFIGDDMDSQQFGSYALHIGSSHYASGSYNLSIGDSGIEQNADYSVLIGRSGGIQAHKTWGTDVYNMGQSNQLQGLTGGFSFGRNHTISNGQWNVIFGGSNHTISSSGNYNAFLGGYDSTITGGTNVIGVGLTGRTGLSQSNTTYVENTHAFRTYSTEVQSVSSGTTFTCNLNNGGKAQFYLTGASTIDITNVRDGQSFLIKTQTDGGHTITWTSTGYTFKFKGGSSNPGNNKIDLFRFEVFGTVIYGELVSDFS